MWGSHRIRYYRYFLKRTIVAKRGNADHSHNLKDLHAKIVHERHKRGATRDKQMVGCNHVLTPEFEVKMVPRIAGALTSFAFAANPLTLLHAVSGLDV